MLSTIVVTAFNNLNKRDIEKTLKFLFTHFESDKTENVVIGRT